jgi:hypothetical protein
LTTGTLELEFDLEPERTLLRRLMANRLSKGKAEALKIETMAGAPPRITMGDYCKMTDNDQISLGFQPS